jgi:hypothetical protein
VSMPDRRTVGELVADSEALARQTLLDATPEQAPAMVRSWNQLVGSAAELWAVLPSAPNSPSWSDPMERLRAIGEAISRSVTAGHWPGQGGCQISCVSTVVDLELVGWVFGAAVPPAFDDVPVLGAVKIVPPVGGCILTAPARRQVWPRWRDGGAVSHRQIVGSSRPGKAMLRAP